MQPFARRYAVAPQQRALVVALSLGAAFAVLTAAATTGLTVSLDTRIILALGAGQSVGLIRVMVAASWLAGSGAVPLALLLAAVLYRRSGRRTAWLYAATCLSGWASNPLLKELTHRTRPMDISPRLTPAGFYSYPSGHSMLAALVFGFGALLLTRTVHRADLRFAILGVAAIVTLLVGVSRIYLGAHWPTDVLGGLLAGAGWAATCLAATRSRGVAPA